MDPAVASERKYDWGMMAREFAVPSQTPWIHRGYLMYVRDVSIQVSLLLFSHCIFDPSKGRGKVHGIQARATSTLPAVATEEHAH